MVDKKIIEYILIKCSNDEIKDKLSRLSQEEKNEKLIGKLNPLEKKEYDDLVNEQDFWSMIDEDTNHEDPTAIEELNRINGILFDYEKRIYRGYDLDKNKSNVPVYDVDDYVEDAFIGMYDNNLGQVEIEQINHQRDTVSLSDNEKQGLRAYFGNEYKHINGELDERYGDGYWNRLNKSEQDFYHEKNKVLVPSIDSAIDKNTGLTVSTILYHGTNDSNLINIHTRIGDHIKTKGYVSTSFNRRVGEGYGSMPGCFVIQFLAPVGTKGLSANIGGLTDELGEHEYLLGRGQSGTVVDIDYDNKPPLCRVLLDG